MFYPYRLTYVVAEDPSSYKTPQIQPAHLWHSQRKDIASLRKQLFRQWLLASVELWILIFLISTIYLGTGNNPSRYTNNLDVNVVDFDGDLAGRYFVNAFRQTPPGNATLHWRYKDASDYNHDVDEARGEVERGKVWATVILRTNTTRLINKTLQALTNATGLVRSPFSITSPVLVIYEDGRGSFSVNNYVLPPIRSAIAVASTRYGQAIRTMLINDLSLSANASINRTLQLSNILKLGSLVVDPLAATYQNLHPASPFVGQLATTLGYVYLYLIAGAAVGGSIKFLSPFGTFLLDHLGKIHAVDLLLFRVLSGVFQAFIISLIYSLIVLWFFGIHSGGLFMRYWMFNWLSTMVLGLIVVLFTINLGSLATSLLTIFVILMLAGSTIQLTLELSHRFYRYGYGLPLFHIVNGARHLLFNSHSRFGLDVGVLLIYYGVLWLSVTATSFYWIKRRERKLAKEKEQSTTAKKQKLPAGGGRRR